MSDDPAERMIPRPKNFNRRAFLRSALGASAGGFLSAVGSNTATAQSEDIRWEFTKPDDWVGPSVVENSTIYAPGADSNLYAVDATSGEEQWRFEYNDGDIWPPAVDDNMVYMPADGSSLYALDATTGEVLWQFNTPRENVWSPTVADGTVYVGDVANLYAVDATTGEEQWRFTTPNDWINPPVVHNGTVYAPSGDSTLYAVDTATGQEQWRFSTPNDYVLKPAVTDDSVYVSSGDSNLYAVDATTGDEEWRFSTPNDAFWSPTVANGTVYAGNDDSKLYAVDADTGNEQWQFNTFADAVWGQAFANETVYAPTSGSNFYAIDATTGEEKWHLTISSNGFSKPVVADDTVYVPTGDSTLYAVKTNPDADVINVGDDGASSMISNIFDPERGPTGEDHPVAILLGTLGTAGLWLHRKGDSSVGAVDGEYSEKYWKAIQLISGALVISYMLGYISYAIHGIPDDIGISISNYPITAFLVYFFGILLFVGPIPLSYFISKDKRELSNISGDVKQRHWIIIIIISYLTIGVYPLWYMFARYNKVSSAGLSPGSKTTTDDKPIAGHEDRDHTTTSDSTSPDMNSDSSTSTEHSITPEQNTSSTDDSDGDSSRNNPKTDDKILAKIKSLRKKGETLYKNGQDYHSSMDYADALDRYHAAQTVYEEALEIVNRNGLIDTTPIEQVLADIEEEQRDVRYQQLRDEVDTLDNTIREVDSLIQKRNFETTQSILQSLTSDIESSKEQADEHGFTDLHEELGEIEQRRVKRLDEVSNKLTTDSIPESIPQAPEVSIVYDDLSEGETIGRGGNADVRKATLDTSNGEMTVAIKEPRMAGTLHTDAIKRMLEEAETWDKLDDHDHIVGVVDYAGEPLPWIAMEYMDGGHLGEMHREIDMQQALWTAIAITKGVRHAHRRGIAHLDIKPENVLFRSVEDTWNVPKVADWGLSKHLLDHSNSVEGLSPKYAAPEQFDEEYGSADDITDIYQLGAVFYELFTGQPPFEGKPFQVIDKVKNESPTPPSEIVDVPEEVDEILLTALAKEKADRYDNVAYLRDALQDVYEKH